MPNKTPADAYVMWLHETERLYWRDCLGDKLWFIAHDLTRGFLFTEDPEVHSKIEIDVMHQWKSKGVVPDGCSVFSNDSLKRLYLKAIEEDTSPFDVRFIVKNLRPT